MSEIRFSVLMPTYNQCAFIRRAILSLMQQTYDKWELIIINDGCTDETEEFIADYLADERITYIKNEENTGLGHALNQGLNAARYDYIAYLPSDDFYYKDHLQCLKNGFEQYDESVLVFSGMAFDSCDSLHSTPEIETVGIRKGYGLQLVQVSHKKSTELWIERSTWISDDLTAMYWHKLMPYGIFVRTEEVTAYWTKHPSQRHRIINEKYGGGINKVRSYYRIKNPIKIKVAKEKFTDEEELYETFRKPCPVSPSALKILLVGELAYNPERVYALEEAGHKLYGLWVPQPALSFFTVGHLPFGHVEDVSYENWQEEVRRIKPDIIYAMLNWGAISFAYDVMKALPEIPFAWHFKEGPHMTIGNGTWEKLIYLYAHADLRIYINNTVRKWYEQFIPKVNLSFIMDGDLPKRDYFTDNYSEKLSSMDGEIHTVCAGRLIGLNERILHLLANLHIHVHLYIENFHASSAKILQYYQEKEPHYFHLHHHCPAKRWTEEFSRYDAAWLHYTKSHNGGDLIKATWDDLNIPARISCYMAAGLPVIQFDNCGNLVAVEEIVRRYDIGIQFHNIKDLSEQLHDKEKMDRLKSNVFHNRFHFSFDFYVPQLVEMFNKAIEYHHG